MFKHKSIIFGAALTSLVLTLTACGDRQDLAPVTELNWRNGNSHAIKHVVRRGETLYAIAFRYDTDYRDLALINNLQTPYILRVGQVIQLRPSATRYTRPQYYKPATSHYVQRQSYRPAPVAAWRYSGHWLWPAQGRVVANFVPQQGKKGLDIAGRKGDRIYASANGHVAYAGSGLAGYGNLIIIKHDNQFLTAYGNNTRNLVKEGQFVKAGQVIAEMGVVDRRFWGVHFENREAGKPVNPLNYLRKR